MSRGFFNILRKFFQDMGKKNFVIGGYFSHRIVVVIVTLEDSFTLTGKAIIHNFVTRGRR
jgi:hypothetical protein